MSPDAYELGDGRFVQETTSVGAADALTVQSNPCPAGKIWTVLAAKYNPDVAETRTVFFSCVTASGAYYPITIPTSYASLAGGLRPWPMLTEGTEMKVFAGERIEVRRDVATVGSSMYLFLRFIETDLPYYSYEEPLRKVVRTARRRGTVFQPSGGGPGGIVVPTEEGGFIPGEGGGGEPQY